jgi:hypothetical protein
MQRLHRYNLGEQSPLELQINQVFGKAVQTLIKF